MSVTSIEQISLYTGYISAGLRYSLKETGLKQFPDSTSIACFTIYSPLAQMDSLLGMPILVTIMQTTYEFTLVFNSEEESNYKLLQAFDDYIQIYSIKE